MIEVPILLDPAFWTGVWATGAVWALLSDRLGLGLLLLTLMFVSAVIWEIERRAWISGTCAHCAAGIPRQLPRQVRGEMHAPQKSESSR